MKFFKPLKTFFVVSHVYRDNFIKVIWPKQAILQTSTARMVSWTKIDPTKIGHIINEIPNYQYLNNLIFVKFQRLHNLKVPHFCLTLFCF